MTTAIESRYPSGRRPARPRHDHPVGMLIRRVGDLAEPVGNVWLGHRQGTQALRQRTQIVLGGYWISSYPYTQGNDPLQSVARI